MNRTNKNIFMKFLCMAVAMVLALPVWAANNGCDDEDNDMIAAEFALCSTHVYNIGEIKNQDQAGRDLMKKVIAMKTTFITQQMYKQYDEMESMVRRLKTQLKKAILTNDMKAAGAESESDNSSSGSGGAFVSADQSIKIAGAENCVLLFDDEKMLECYQKNINLLTNQSNYGSNPTREMKMQLAQDFKRLSEQNIGGDDDVCKTQGDSGITNNFKICFNEDTNNPGRTKMMSNKEFANCLNEMRVCIQKQMRAYKETLTKKDDK